MLLSKALKEWETRESKVATEAPEILLFGGMAFETKRVFINRIDGVVNTLSNCE
jgi:hypothetical protein